MPLVDTDADLSRIKSLIAQPALVESGLLSRTVLEQANAILGPTRRTVRDDDERDDAGLAHHDGDAI